MHNGSARYQVKPIIEKYIMEEKAQELVNVWQNYTYWECPSDMPLGSISPDELNTRFLKLTWTMYGAMILKMYYILLLEA